jgi:GTPase
MGDGHLASAKREKMGWEEICKRAAKVISFIDLAGHERWVFQIECQGDS